MSGHRKLYVKGELESITKFIPFAFLILSLGGRVSKNKSSLKISHVYFLCKMAI